MPTLTQAENASVTENLMKVRDIAKLAEDESRDFTEAEEKECTDRLSKIRAIKDAAVKRAGISESLSEFGDLVQDPDTGLVTPQKGKRVKNHSLGQHFTKSDEYGNLMSRASNGVFGEKTPVGTMQPVSAPLSPWASGKDLVSSGAGFTYDSAGSAGNFVDVQHLGLTQDATTYQRPLVIAQLFSHGQTTTDTIDYIVTDTPTNNAAPVAEATTDAGPSVPAGTDDDGGDLVYPDGAGLKPQSAVSFTRHKQSVRTIAHGISITKRALSDAAQVMTFIDNFLQYGLAYEVESQLLTGDGTGENLLGLAHVSGTLAQAQAPVDVNLAARTLATYRKAKTKIRTTAHVVPTAYVMNPADAETLDLAAMTTGQYLNGSPFSGGQSRTLWGLPVVESESVTSGTPWLAAWDRGVIFDRMQSTMSMTDSHADFFMRNLVQILAELRMAFIVLNPAAFCKITLPTTNS